MESDWTFQSYKRIGEERGNNRQNSNWSKRQIKGNTIINVIQIFISWWEWSVPGWEWPIHRQGHRGLMSVNLIQVTRSQMYCNLNLYGRFWTDRLDSTLQHHHPNKNLLEEWCFIPVESLWLFQHIHFMLAFPLICHLSYVALRNKLNLLSSRNYFD